MQPERVEPKILPMVPAPAKVDLADAVQIVQEHFRKICHGFLTFRVIASLNEPALPFMAIRCAEHCLVETRARIHDVIVSRDGTIYATKFIGNDGDALPTFSGRP